MESIKNLFIVDDDKTYTFLTETMIKKLNIVKHIKVFNDARDAIRFIKLNIDESEQLPELIFLDLNMPIMNGWDFLKEFESLKVKLDKKITIYIVTSSINPVDFERAISTKNVSDFVIKPITKEKFIALANKYISGL